MRRGEETQDLLRDDWTNILDFWSETFDFIFFLKKNYKFLLVRV